MAKMKKRTFKEKYVQVPNETAKAPEKRTSAESISLGALGLIVNLWSYDLDSFEVHKTELYRRYEKNKESSVRGLWKELMDAKFMVEYKYRIGKKWEYEYVFNIEPFTNEEIQIIRQEAIEEHKKIWGLDFQDLKMKTSNCRPQNQDISNTEFTQDKLKQDKLKQNKALELNIDNNSITDIKDDDEKEPFEINIYAFKEFVKDFQRDYPNLFDNDMFNAIYEQMYYQELEVITTHEAIVQARYMDKRIEQGELEVGDYATYFVGGIKKKRTSQRSAIDKRTILKATEAIKAEKEKKRQEQRELPNFRYNWLEN